MEWLKENWFKLASLGVVLVIGLGYVNFLNTKEDNRQAEEAQKQLQASIEADQKLEAENKKYQADRKSDCLDIYQTESDKWNNVTGWRYAEEDDICYIEYKDGEQKTEEECDEKFPIGDDWGLIFFSDNLLCKNGKFQNEF